MTAQQTRARAAGDWIGPPPSQTREPAITSGLPVPAEDGGAIAVLQAQEFAARRRRAPFAWCRWLSSCWCRSRWRPSIIS